MAAPRHLPRLLTVEEAADYCGCSTAEFIGFVKSGLMPPSIPILSRWDKVAIDRILDKMSGLGEPEKPAEPEMTDLERFKAERAARKAAPGQRCLGTGARRAR